MPVENDSTAPTSIGYIVLRNAVCPTDVATLLAVANDRKRAGNGARPDKDKNGRSYPGSPGVLLGVVLVLNVLLQRTPINLQDSCGAHARYIA